MVIQINEIEKCKVNNLCVLKINNITFQITDKLV